VNKKKTINKT